MSSSPARILPDNQPAATAERQSFHPAPFPRRCPYGCGDTVVEKYADSRTKYACTKCENEVQYVDF